MTFNFGDRVKVLDNPSTQNALIAGRVGRVEVVHRVNGAASAVDVRFPDAFQRVPVAFLVIA